MTDCYQDVLDFHQKFGCYVGTSPSIPTAGTPAFRQRLIDEEHGELREALEQGDLAGVADAIADLIYVVLGTAISYGIDIRPIWDEVHRTNMAKEGGGSRADGKILKPEGWEPPDIAGLLNEQCRGKEAAPFGSLEPGDRFEDMGVLYIVSNRPHLALCPWDGELRRFNDGVIVREVRRAARRPWGAS